MSDHIEFVTWKWKPPKGYRSTFDGTAVNVLASMLARCYRAPHRLTCLTDDATGIDSSVRVLPLQAPELASLRNPSNLRNPSCYRRLWTFSKEACDVLGPRVITLDLDVVFTGDVTELFDVKEDFRIWGGQAISDKRPDPYNWYNGSLWYLRTGTRQKVWDTFIPHSSPMRAHMAGNRGSDQGWIAYALGPKEATFKHADGVHSFRNHIIPNGGRLFPFTKFVSFHGGYDPWQKSVQMTFPWVKEHYR